MGNNCSNDKLSMNAFKDMNESLYDSWGMIIFGKKYECFRFVFLWISSFNIVLVFVQLNLCYILQIFNPKLKNDASFSCLSICWWYINSEWILYIYIYLFLENALHLLQKIKFCEKKRNSYDFSFQLSFQNSLIRTRSDITRYVLVDIVKDNRIWKWCH